MWKDRDFVAKDFQIGCLFCVPCVIHDCYHSSDKKEYPGFVSCYCFKQVFLPNLDIFLTGSLLVRMWKKSGNISWIALLHKHVSCNWWSFSKTVLTTFYHFLKKLFCRNEECLQHYLSLYLYPLSSLHLYKLTLYLQISLIGYRSIFCY